MFLLLQMFYLVIISKETITFVKLVEQFLLSLLLCITHLMASVCLYKLLIR